MDILYQTLWQTQILVRINCLILHTDFQDHTLIITEEAHIDF